MSGGTHLYYLGHASFRWVTPSGTSIVIDPYGNPTGGRWFNYPIPEVEAGLVLLTHAHFDHNATGRIKGDPEIFDKAGIRRGKDFIVHSFTGRHARPEEYGAENRICIIEINGVRFCHWGDNGSEITDDLLNLPGRVDVLMLSVDESEHLLTLSEVGEITEYVSPNIVIPVHYFDPSLTSTLSTLKPIDRWLKQQPRIRKIPASGIKITSESLPQKREVWVFERYIPKSNSN